MEIRKRSQKAVARRHDLNYFKKGSPIRHWQWKLAAGAIAAGLIWVAIVSLSHGRQLLSKGPISSSHAVFGAKCEACHVDEKSALSQDSSFRRHVPDAACQSCHQEPDHQTRLALASFSTPECGTCHVEHTGSMMLANASDKTCATCHADLKSSHYASNIHSFTDGHPQFAPLRSGYQDDQKIKFNHQAHMQKGLKGPDGLADLNCADCHRTPAVRTLTPWRFGTTPQLREASLDMPPAAQTGATVNPSHRDPLHPTDNRAYMAPTAYAESCHDCHALKFDKHITDEAPHTSPEEVRKFIREKIQAYAAQNPQIVAAEIRNWTDEPMAKVPQYRPMSPPRNAQEWVAVRSRQAERRLWYQSCNLCHVMKIPDDSPTVVAASLRSVQYDTLTVHTMTVATVAAGQPHPANRRSHQTEDPLVHRRRLQPSGPHRGELRILPRAYPHQQPGQRHPSAGHRLMPEMSRRQEQPARPGARVRPRRERLFPLPSVSRLDPSPDSTGRSAQPRVQRD